MLKLLSKTLATKFWNNKDYISTTVLLLSKKFFGYDFLNGKFFRNKLTIYCPDSHIANEIFLKRTFLLNYINSNLANYNITNTSIKEIKVVTKAADEYIYTEKQNSEEINYDLLT